MRQRKSIQIIPEHRIGRKRSYRLPALEWCTRWHPVAQRGNNAKRLHSDSLFTTEDNRGPRFCDSFQRALDYNRQAEYSLGYSTGWVLEASDYEWEGYTGAIAGTGLN